MCARLQGMRAPFITRGSSAQGMRATTGRRQWHPQPVAVEARRFAWQRPAIAGTALAATGEVLASTWHRSSAEEGMLAATCEVPATTWQVPWCSWQLGPGPFGPGLVLQSRERLTKLASADDVAGDDEFHATILLPAFRGAVGGHRLRFAEAGRGDGVRRNSLLHEIGLHRGRATL